MSTSDDRFERQLAEMLDDAAPTRPPASLVADTEREIDETRRWPGRWATLREPPMRHGSAIVVGSSSARRVAIVAATLLLVLVTLGAGIAGANLLSESATFVVDQTGDGDTTTIAEAVARADDEDTILVRPGTYSEAVVVDKDIEIIGDGPPESIIWAAPPDGPRRQIDVTGRWPYAVLIDDASAKLSDLTFSGRASAIHIEGGAPTVEHLLLDGVGQPHTHSSGRYSFADAIAVTGPSRAVVRDNILREGGSIAAHPGSEPLIVGNQLTDGPSILVYAPGEEIVLRGNSVGGSIDRGIGVFGPNRMTIEDNIVTDAGGAGISVGRGFEPENDSLVRDNTISRTRVGVEVASGAAPRIESNSVDDSDIGIDAMSLTDGLIAIGNELHDNDRGISVAGSDARFEENVVQGGDIGALVFGSGSPTFERNTFDAASRGFVIDGRSSPVLTGNRICSLGDHVVADDEVTDRFDSDNEICEDAQAPIVVDQTGDGDTTTIGEAVAMAEDGDRILIRPGTYVEAVIVDTDVSISGDGERASIVWSAPEDGPTGPNVTGQHQFALRLDHVSATLRGITLKGRDSAVHVAGGNATLTELTFDGVGEAHTSDLGRGTFADAVALYDFGQATVTDSHLQGGGPIVAYEDSVSVIERNTLSGGPSIHVFKPVEGSVVRGNRISGSRVRAIGVYGGPSQLLIEDNVIDGSGADGIEVGIVNDEDGNSAIVRGNEVSGAFTAISTAENAAPTITDNRLTGNDIGVWVTRGVERTRVAQNTLADNDIGIRALGGTTAIEDNVIDGGATGIQLVWDAEPTVTDNTVTGATTVGLSIDSSSTGAVTGNHICDNATNLDVEPEVEADIRAANDICVEAPSEIIVDPEGNGDATTIAQALAVAGDGSEIIVRPGIYREALALAADVTIRGDGDRDEIIVMAPTDGPTHAIDGGSVERYVLLLADSDALISDMTLRGAVVVEGDASPELVENVIDGPVALGGAGQSMLSDNRLRRVSVDQSSSAIVRRNTFSDPDGESTSAIEVEQRHGNGAQRPVLIEDNRIQGPYPYGIWVMNNRGLPVSVSGNDVRGADVGVRTGGTAAIDVDGNDLHQNETAIRVGSDVAAVTITDNAIESNTVGVQIFGSAWPAMSGNRFCGNGADLDATAGTRVTLAFDDICEDAAIE